MREQRLHFVDLGATLQQMRGKSPAQGVRRQAGQVQLAGVMADAVGQEVGGKLVSLVGQEQAGHIGVSLQNRSDFP